MATDSTQHPSITPEQLVAELDDWDRMLRRSIGGFNFLWAVYNQLQGTLPAGERLRGKPILQFPATANGQDKEMAVLDMGKLPPADVNAMLGPMLNVFKTQIAESLDEIQTRHEMLRQIYNLTPPPVVELP